MWAKKKTVILIFTNYGIRRKIFIEIPLELYERYRFLARGEKR
jgi:hypothetical protein